MSETSASRTTQTEPSDWERAALSAFQHAKTLDGADAGEFVRLVRASLPRLQEFTHRQTVLPFAFGESGTRRSVTYRVTGPTDAPERSIFIRVEPGMGRLDYEPRIVSVLCLRNSVGPNLRGPVAWLPSAQEVTSLADVGKLLAQERQGGDVTLRLASNHESLESLQAVVAKTYEGTLSFVEKALANSLLFAATTEGKLPDPPGLGPI